MQLWTDPAMVHHDPGGPERPARLGAVVQALEILPSVTLRAPQAATPEQLARVHHPAYVEALLETAGRPIRLDPDTATSERSIEAALLAAGAARQAVLSVLDGPDPHAFAAVRPPGHHASAGRGMGFCLFNNVVAAAGAARAERNVERVLIVDWDVHHGNGTEDMVIGRPDTLFFSTHQGPGFYPGTGQHSRDNVLNVPLRAGSGDAEVLAAFTDVLVPAAEAFAPDLVLVSAGFDAHRDDPLGGLLFTAPGFAALTDVVRGIAEVHAGGRVVLVLEGGYDLDALGACSVACVEALA